MASLPGFDVQVPQPVVNVASVPQRSPFRYPGGKTWLIPHFRTWVRSLPSRPALFIEPFAGGGVISLTAAMEDLADKVVMGEIDPAVASVWETIIHGDYSALVDRIMSFRISREAVIEELSRQPQTELDRAFLTLLRNRVQRGGIIAPGASLVRSGEDGKGVASRWYPRTLANRIRTIARVRERIQFTRSDGLDLISRFASLADAAFFIDPPYTAGGKKAGKRLYAFNELDHARLFSLLAQVRGPALITYDDAPEPFALALRHHFAVDKVAMANTHHSTMLELLITKQPSLPQQREA
jgi:DNA adenine methylase